MLQEADQRHQPTGDVDRRQQAAAPRRGRRRARRRQRDRRDREEPQDLDTGVRRAGRLVRCRDRPREDRGREERQHRADHCGRQAYAQRARIGPQQELRGDPDRARQVPQRQLRLEEDRVQVAQVEQRDRDRGRTYARGADRRCEPRRDLPVGRRSARFCHAGVPAIPAPSGARDRAQPIGPPIPRAAPAAAARSDPARAVGGRTDAA